MKRPVSVVDIQGPYLSTQVFGDIGHDGAAEGFHVLLAAHPVVKGRTGRSATNLLSLLSLIGRAKGFDRLFETFIEDSDFVPWRFDLNDAEITVGRFSRTTA